MLQIKKISKIYRTDEIETKALDEVSLNLRRNEFVSILGPSGSGKTTLLNIIGGLDHYTSGDLIIDGTSTKDYKDGDWDAYRNHRVGFVFQSYNLIAHQSILSNVELALTLSGVSGAEKKQRATEALKKVGLGDHLNKRPSQLSGGQMQRVAIARALVNNPDIILADEPTGALDSKTSVQIMELLKEIAKDKLVVMVTHNPELAKQYSTRIVTVKDGRLVDDTDPFDGQNESRREDHKKHSSMSFKTALSLSFNNLLTKRGRTLLTAIAGSIGIIGIALILALTNGVNNYAGSLVGKGSMPSPYTIQETYSDNSTFTSASADSEASNDPSPSGTITATDDLSGSYQILRRSAMRHNDTASLKKYIEAHRADLADYVATVQYDYGLPLQVFDKDSTGEIFKVNPVEKTTVTNTNANLFATDTSEVTVVDLVRSSFSEIVSAEPYEILSGALPENAGELLLVVDPDGKLPLTTMYALGLEDRAQFNAVLAEVNAGETPSFSAKTYDYDTIIGKTYRALPSDFSASELSEEEYAAAMELKIVGVAKVKNGSDQSGFLGYTSALAAELTPEADQETPQSISLYAKAEKDKPRITAFLDAYNNEASDAQKVHYEDQTAAATEAIRSIVNMLSYVLISFVAISLVVSSIMIGIITYISVLERTKEIGILRAVGASKRDVVRVFRAETVIEGFAAGFLGVFVSWLICFAVNAIVSAAAHIDNIAAFNVWQALVLILISIILTVFAGASPARRASKKDPVEALRSE